MHSPIDTIRQQIEAEQLLERTLARINARVLGFTMGALGALGLFAATLVLLLKGGDEVGAHLGLLGNFFWGYDVSWPGLLPALFYGGLTGYVAGYLISRVYNAVARLRKPNGENLNTDKA